MQQAPIFIAIAKIFAVNRIMLTETYVLNKKVKLLQPAKGFRASMDSVMLAAAVNAEPGQKVLDAGCGVGTVGLCLLHRLPELQVTAIDLQSDLIATALENARGNSQENRIQFIADDVTRLKGEYLNVFDHFVTNPPYFSPGRHLVSHEESKALAMAGEGVLPSWMEAASRLLKPKGTLTLIYPAESLVAVLNAASSKFGAFELIPVWSRQGQPAKRIILRAIKNRKGSMTILPGVVLHNRDGEYTKEANAVFRDGAGLYDLFQY